MIDLQKNNHVHSFRASPSSRKGFRGLYIFSLKPRLIFEKAGEYTFSCHIVSNYCDASYYSFLYLMSFKTLYVSFSIYDVVCHGFGILQKESNCSNCVNSVKVKALSQVKSWGLVRDMQHAKLSVRYDGCHLSYSGVLLASQKICGYKYMLISFIPNNIWC